MNRKQREQNKRNAWRLYERNPMNWIKTSKRLPTDLSQEVVIQNKAGEKFIARIHFHNSTDPAWDVEAEPLYFDVWEYCYWTELPPLPEEQGCKPHCEK